MTEPGKHPKEEFLWLGVRWTPGALKTVLAVLAGAAGSGLVFWDKLAAWLAIAPVWAVVAFLGMAAVLPYSAEAASVSRVSSVVFVAGDYELTRRFFQ